MLNKKGFSMKEKLLNLYLSAFLLMTFISSALFMNDLLSKLNLPDMIDSIVCYGYFLVHIASYVGLLLNADKFIKTEKGE